MPLKIDYSTLPYSLQQPARLYIEHGVPPGDFFSAILANDLKEAFARADDHNKSFMATIVHWLYNQCPMVAQGSEENIQAWMDHKGMEKYADASQDS